MLLRFTYLILITMKWTHKVMMWSGDTWANYLIDLRDKSIADCLTKYAAEQFILYVVYIIHYYTLD